MPIAFRKNLWEPRELLRFLVNANIVLYLTSLFIAPAAVNLALDPAAFLAPSTAVLFKLGLSGTIPVFAEDRWWTLITANYLHGSLLHLVFNVFALHAVGKANIEIYSSSRLFLIYFLGGVLSMGISSLVGIALTLGASGAICALIGSMSYDQWRASRGDLFGRFRSVGVWIVLLIISGVAMPSVNNWAHATGFVSGFLLGFLFWHEASKIETIAFRVAATASLLLTIATLIYGLLLS